MDSLVALAERMIRECRASLDDDGRRMVEMDKERLSDAIVAALRPYLAPVGVEAFEGLRRELAAANEDARGLAEALAGARAVLAEMAEPQQCYGAGGGDPRDFDPDPECSTEEERARHAADCEKAARGEPIETLTGCHHVGAALVSYQGWGLGTYTYLDEEAIERLAAVDAALAAHRARGGGQ